MKIEFIKKCDVCGKRGSHKRFSVACQFPFYDYMGFDLCSDCEGDFIRMLEKFLNNWGKRRK